MARRWLLAGLAPVLAAAALLLSPTESQARAETKTMTIGAGGAPPAVGRGNDKPLVGEPALTH